MRKSGVLVDEARQERLKELLRESRRHLWTQIRGDVFGKLADDRAGFPPVADSVDLSVQDLMESIGNKLTDIHQDELRKMAEAERKLEKGTYGICERCGQEISEARLRAIPYAVHCVQCAEILEGETIRGKGPTL